MQTMKISVAIVDDQELIADALASMVQTFEAYNVSLTCFNGQELVQHLATMNPLPQVVLLDISMPIMNGFETALWLKTNHPNIKILTLSVDDSESSLLKMYQNGAKGYLLKNTSRKELLYAMNTIVDNRYYYPDWIQEKQVLESTKKMENDLPVSEISNLTAREIEFLRYCAKDIGYKEIALLMKCSVRTLDGYRDNLQTKLNCKSRVGLAIAAYRLKLVD